MPKGVRSYESCLGITHVGTILVGQEVRGHTREPRGMVAASGSGASRLDFKSFLWHPRAT